MGRYSAYSKRDTKPAERKRKEAEIAAAANAREYDFLGLSSSQNGWELTIAHRPGSIRIDRYHGYTSRITASDYAELLATLADDVKYAQYVYFARDRTHENWRNANADLSRCFIRHAQAVKSQYLADWSGDRDQAATYGGEAASLLIAAHEAYVAERDAKAAREHYHANPPATLDAARDYLASLERVPVKD